MKNKYIDLTPADVKVSAEISEMLKKAGSIEKAVHTLTMAMMLLLATHPDARNHPEYGEEAETYRNMALDYVLESYPARNC